MLSVGGSWGSGEWGVALAVLALAWQTMSNIVSWLHNRRASKSAASLYLDQCEKYAKEFAAFCASPDWHRFGYSMPVVDARFLGGLEPVALAVEAVQEASAPMNPLARDTTLAAAVQSACEVARRKFGIKKVANAPS